MKWLLILLFLPIAIFSQNQESKVLFYNVGFGGITAGIGAIINKKSEPWKKCFLRGFWQGSIGGLLNYSAKKSIYLVNKNSNVAYALPARVISSAGNSIIQNAAANQPFLQNWNFEYGFFRVDFSTGTKSKFGVRILPESIIASAILLSKGKPDIHTTLLTGVMSFKSNNLIYSARGAHDGVNYGRAFLYLDSSTKYHVIAHEIIHEFQYREYLVFNSFFKTSVSKINAPALKKLFTQYIYPDVPYFGLFYMLEGINPSPMIFRNYFEFEAERFGTNKFVIIK
jgi:hypothetical protein